MPRRARPRLRGGEGHRSGDAPAARPDVQRGEGERGVVPGHVRGSHRQAAGAAVAGAGSGTGRAARGERSARAGSARGLRATGDSDPRVILAPALGPRRSIDIAWASVLCHGRPMARPRIELTALLADPLGTMKVARRQGWLAELDEGTLEVLTHERVRELLADGRLHANFADFLHAVGVTSGPFHDLIAVSPLNHDGT